MEYVIYDEVAAWAAGSEEKLPSLAAGPDRMALRLEMIGTAKANGASWAVIGATLGMSGPEAKRHARRLRDQVRRASLPAAGEEG